MEEVIPISLSSVHIWAIPNSNGYVWVGLPRFQSLFIAPSAQMCLFSKIKKTTYSVKLLRLNCALLYASMYIRDCLVHLKLRVIHNRSDYLFRLEIGLVLALPHAAAYCSLSRKKGFLKGCWSETLGWQVLVGEAALELAEKVLAQERLMLPRGQWFKPKTEGRRSLGKPTSKATPTKVSIDSTTHVIEIEMQHSPYFTSILHH